MIIYFNNNSEQQVSMCIDDKFTLMLSSYEKKTIEWNKEDIRISLRQEQDCSVEKHRLKPNLYTLILKTEYFCFNVADGQVFNIISHDREILEMAYHVKYEWLAMAEDSLYKHNIDYSVVNGESFEEKFLVNIKRDRLHNRFVDLPIGFVTGMMIMTFITFLPKWGMGLALALIVGTITYLMYISITSLLRLIYRRQKKDKIEDEKICSYFDPQWINYYLNQ